MRFLLPLVAVLFLPATISAQEACAAPDHRAFDFWIGTWEVYRPDGSLAGTNTIRSILGGCVLHESYATPGGYAGESFNAWDRGRAVWHQTWVDNGGLVLRIEGGLQDGSMVLEGETIRADGIRILNRITWSVTDDSGDRVRQHWEISRDGGESWTTAFDGDYRRVGG